MTASSLRAEQVIWLTLLEMMGGAAVGTLTNTRPLISGMSSTSRRLEFAPSPSLGLSSSFGAVEPLIRNLAISFRHVGVAEVPTEVRHWKNPQFKVCTSSIELHVLSAFETASGGTGFSRSVSVGCGYPS